jgi:outer membrane protein TolC
MKESPMPKRSIISIALVLLVAASVPLPAQTPAKLVLSLEESLKLALLQNPQVLAESTKEDQASAVVSQALANFFPQVTAQGTDILDKKVFSVLLPAFFPGMEPQRFKFDFTRTYQATFNFSLPLYSGGRIKSGYKSAGYNLQATREGIRRIRQETVFNVKKAFYGCLLARQFRDVAQEAVTLAEKHLKNVRNMYDVGMATKFDLLRTEVQLANLQPQLIKARNALALAEIGLKTLLGLDLGREIEVQGELGYKDVEANLDASVVQALSVRPEILQFNLQKEIAAEMLKSAKAAYLPTVGIGAQYNLWADNFRFSGDTWEDYYSIALVLSVPITNGFMNRAKIGESKAILKQLEYGQKGLSDMVRYEVQEAVLNLRQAKESLLSQEKNVEQAREAVRIAELNYAEGLATNLDVSSVQVALSQARTNFSQAQFDYAVALAQLEKAVGAGEQAAAK